jgi:hypothetical protein
MKDSMFDYKTTKMSAIDKKSVCPRLQHSNVSSISDVKWEFVFDEKN